MRLILYAVMVCVLSACPSAGPKGNNANNANNANNSNNANNANNGNNSNNGNDFFACTQTLECRLRPNGCCDSCQPWDTDNTIGINVAFEQDYLSEVCANNNGICPECASQPNPNMVPTCNAGQCEAVDLLMTDITECAVDMDCMIRSRRCCECGGDAPGDVIAIANGAESDLVSLVCDEAANCLTCEPDYSAYVAVCDDGRCAARPLE